jgi:TatD DNase family protein
MRLTAAKFKPREFIRLGFKLGFGGAVTFDGRCGCATWRLCCPWTRWYWKPTHPIFLRIGFTPPHRIAWWQTPGRNEPAELPRIAEVVAALRGMPVEALAHATTHNACVALPRLSGLLV